jgi:hypothetical protein
MPWNFAYSSLGRRWAILHDHVVAMNKEPLQIGELFKNAHGWLFFTESNVTVAWLGTLLWQGLAQGGKTAGQAVDGLRKEGYSCWVNHRVCMGRRESSPNGGG